MTTIWGWDASHYDAVPTGKKVVSEGIAFMTHKAGGDADDTELNAWWKAMLPVRAMVLLGAYWVLRPDRWTSPAADADRFLARLDSQCPGWRNGPFILQLDAEKWNDSAATVPTRSEIAAFCDRLVAKVPKLKPIVYAPKWVYNATLTGLGYPLWASSYVSGSGFASELYPGDTSAKWDAYSGQFPAILQFSSSATIAGQTTCDANAFRGSIVDLIKLVAPGWAPTTPAPSTAGGTTVALTDTDVTKIAKADVFRAPDGSVGPDGEPNATWALNTHLIEIHTKLDAILAALQQTPPTA